jgi:hypothetical protein
LLCRGISVSVFQLDLAATKCSARQLLDQLARHVPSWSQICDHQYEHLRLSLQRENNLLKLSVRVLFHPSFHQRSPIYHKDYLPTLEAIMQALHLLMPLLLLAFLSHYARAQLVGCEAVDCPAGGCIVGSTTNLDLGITKFTSGLSPDHSLTWTVGIADTHHHNAINDTWMKSYYLGTPPSLDLEKESSIGGCALFFEDSGTYQFNHSTPETSIGTCQELWSAECVNDLLARLANVTATLSSNAATTLNQSTFCSELGPALKADLPVSCTATLGLDKIPIVVKGESVSRTSSLPLTL